MKELEPASSRDVQLIKSGKECEPADGVDVMHDEGDAVVDVGVLGCEFDEFCFKDSSSSLGGFCKKVVEADVGGEGNGGAIINEKVGFRHSLSTVPYAGVYFVLYFSCRNRD